MSEKLVVSSKVKEFIKSTYGLNTSAAVMDELSKVVMRECEKASENAKRNNRKTVMDRDFI